jgi:predicted N-acetyltransferase YhbS
MSSLPPITPETADDRVAVEALIEAAFGPGRLVKTAERLRETRTPAPGLSVVAREDGEIVGCARMWDIHIGEAPALLLGPFAVAHHWQNRGLGAALIEAACVRARREGHALVLLVGDEAYFSRMGFHRAERGAVVLPGPVDGRRILVRALKDGAADGLRGEVTAG